MVGAARSILSTLALLGLAPLSTFAQSVRICAIQGTGATPAMLGARVSAAGVVTADFQRSLGGFFMQDPGCDADRNTSDGIFVRTGDRTVTAIAGNRVTVTGRVTNDFGLTAIELESLADGGPYAGSVEAVRLQPPADPAAAAAYLESHEGMLVSLAPSRVVAATNHFGEAFVMPESSGVARLFRGDNDGRKLGLAAPAGWLMLNQGDRVSDAAGPLTYTFGQFKVEIPPGRPLTVERSGSQPAPAAALSGTTLSVASYNLENLFDPVDDAGKDDDVPTPEQYAAALDRRAASIARYVGLPDVLGVQEVEKVEVLQDLAARPELLPASYRAVLVEGIDVRGIDVGLLYNSDRLWLRSSEARQGCSDVRPPDGAIVSCALPGGGSGYMLFSRPPLVARLETLDRRDRLTVIVNHFKSQSSDTTADERLRLAQAGFVRALVDELKAAEADVPVVVLGDLNDFEDSPPLQQLVSGGRLVNLLARPGGERPYSYVFQGLCQTLDYVLVDAALAPRVIELKPLHVNVDYGDAGPGAPADATPRASDHDPVRLLLSRP